MKKVWALAIGVIVAMSFTAASATHLVPYTGTDGNDFISTGNGGSIVWALAGDDRVKGGRGTDIIHGGRGNDVLHTGDGGAKEAVWGGRGNDRIFEYDSGRSPGYLNGGAGRDLCVGDVNSVFVRCERIEYR